MKKIRKILPVSLYDIPGLERWLEEQANEGLFPVRFGMDWATFVPTGTPGTRFRVEPSSETEWEVPDPEQIAFYREGGWEYCFAFGKNWFGNRCNFYLFSAVDPSLPDLHTDPVVRGMTLERLARQLRRDRWYDILGIMFLYLLINDSQFYSLFTGQPLSYLDWFQLIFGFLCLFGFRLLSNLTDYRHLICSQEQLARGLEPVPHGPSLRYWALNLTHLIIVAVLLALCVPLVIELLSIIVSCNRMFLF